MSESNPAREPLDAIIVGAGFSGLYMLHRLRDMLHLDVRDRLFQTEVLPHVQRL